MSDVPLPEECATMAEVRAGVDATDRALMALIDRRFGYMRAAARIKASRETVRDEARKAEVIASARADADERGLPAEALAAIWERLVEASIAYELVEWDRLNAATAPPSARAR
jgi:isochorismate pyruvate lyase